MALYVPIKYIAFDLGNTLIKIDKSLIINLLTKNKAHVSDFFDSDFNLLQTGKISWEDFLHKKAQLLNISYLSIEQEFLSMINPHNDNITLLNHLKIPYIFASNINLFHYENIKKLIKPSLFCLRYSVLSFDVGFLKPDRVFFEKIIESLASHAENILFVDDKAKNILCAQSLGFKILYYDNINHSLYEAIKNINNSILRPK
jgi:HAD superfamily hydrolase (TIGR01509 family)